MVGVVELAGYEGVLYKRGRREKKREERRKKGKEWRRMEEMEKGLKTSVRKMCEYHYYSSYSY